MTKHQQIINEILEILNSGDITWTWHSATPRLLPLEKVEEMAQKLDGNSWTPRTINNVITLKITAEYFKEHGSGAAEEIIHDYSDELAKEVLKKDYSPLKFKIA